MYTAVIRSEDDEGILREAVIFEGLEDATDGGVERFNERGVGWVEGLRVGFDALCRRGERDVRVVEGKVEEEGLSLAAFDELHRRVGLAEFAFAALRRFRACIDSASEVFVKTVVGRLMAFTAEVPLAHRRRDVALRLEELGDCLDTVWKMQVDRCGEYTV